MVAVQVQSNFSFAANLIAWKRDDEAAWVEQTLQIPSETGRTDIYVAIDVPNQRLVVWPNATILASGTFFALFLIY